MSLAVALAVPAELAIPAAEANRPVRRRSAHDAVLEAERRGAPSSEIRLLEEAAIATAIARVRANIRAGGAVSQAERRRYERDQELLRRFPDDRRGPDGEGWFHVPAL
jgi:hypothetical protein